MIWPEYLHTSSAPFHVVAYNNSSLKLHSRFCDVGREATYKQRYGTIGGLRAAAFLLSI